MTWWFTSAALVQKDTTELAWRILPASRLFDGNEPLLG